MIAIRSLTTIFTYAISLCGVMPLFPWLTAAPRVILVVALLTGILQDKRGAWPFKPWMQNSIIVPVFIYYALQYSHANPVQPVVSLLAIMLAIRLSGEKTVRYDLQIFALSLFCLASSSLFDLGPMFLVYLGLFIVLVAFALVLVTFYNQDSNMSLSVPELRKLISAGLLMPVLSIPIMFLFFPILPRTQLPLWNFLSSPAGLTSGFSDKVEPGSLSDIGESRVLLYRVEMPRQNRQLYWRGTVFNRLEGNRWVRDRTVPDEEPHYSGQSVTQTIYPEANDAKFLIALDRPSSISLKWSKRTPDGVYEYFGPIGKRLSYYAESKLDDVSLSASSIDKAFYLRLPEGIPPRMQQLAADIRRSGKDSRSRLELLETFFRNGGYRYTTRDLPTGAHALESFLFETRQGHCEFFASAFAILLRNAGVPSRIVGGFLGGDYNELGGYYLVSENMAHVWVEVFIDGSGWLRIDPSSFAENAGTVFGGVTARNLTLRLRLAIDSINHAWNRTVIPYDLEHQMKYIRHAGDLMQGVSVTDIVRNAALFMSIALLLLGLTSVATRKMLFRTREERILRSFLRQAGREFGLDDELKRMGLLEIAAESGNSKMMEFVNIYAGAVYRDKVLTDDEYRQLRQILRGGFGEAPTK